MILRRFAHSTFCVLVLLSTLPVTACTASDEEDDEDASVTTTSALQTQSQAGLTDGVLDVDGALAPGAEEAAKAVAESPLRNLQPAGCAKKTRDGGTVTLELAACTGPFGKVEVSGRLVATFSKPSADVIHVEIAASDLTANGKPLTYASTGDMRFEGKQRFATYRGSSSGTTKRGKAFTRTTDVSVVADLGTQCATMNGVSKGTIGKYDVDLTVDGLTGCRDACPSGGKARAVVDGPLVKNASIEITFDGSSTARAKIDRGEGRKKRERNIPLDCAAAEAEE